VSSARRLVNISGMVRATDLKFSQVKDMDLLLKSSTISNIYNGQPTRASD
jgi:hypothetical protein